MNRGGEGGSPREVLLLPQLPLPVACGHSFFFFATSAVQLRFPHSSVLLPESCSVFILLWGTLGCRPQRGSCRHARGPHLLSRSSSGTAGPQYQPSWAWRLPVLVQPQETAPPALFLSNLEGFEIIITTVTRITLLSLM